MPQYLKWDAVIESVKDSRVSSDQELIVETLRIIVSQLKDSPFSRFGAREADIVSKVRGSISAAGYELIYMILARLCESGFLWARRQQIGTAGTTDIFYCLAEGVEVSTMPALARKTS